jgi:hypothetical protein
MRDDGKLLINIRVTPDEAALLAEYAEQNFLTRTQVIRAYLRSLQFEVTKAGRLRSSSRTWRHADTLLERWL